MADLVRVRPVYLDWCFLWVDFSQVDEVTGVGLGTWCHVGYPEMLIFRFRVEMKNSDESGSNRHDIVSSRW